jgi:hypothetical protein
MIILNFSYSFTENQKQGLVQHLGVAWEDIRVVEVSTKINEQQPLAQEVTELADKAGLTSLEWSSAPLVVNLPGYAPAAAALLAEIEGRRGYLPSIIKMRPVQSGNSAVSYEVAEIVNLFRIFDTARRQR